MEHECLSRVVSNCVLSMDVWVESNVPINTITTTKELQLRNG